MICYTIPMKHFDVVSVGTALQDTIFFTSDAELVKNPKTDPTKLKLIGFEYGAKISSNEISHSFGGGAANTATGMARLGLNNAALVCLGKDPIGQALEESFAKHGIDRSIIQHDPKALTGFSFLVVEKTTNEHVAFAHYGANESLKITPAILKKFRTDWFYVSSLSLATWPAAMRALSATKSNIVWNPGAIQLKEPKVIQSLLKHITVLILNKDEATDLSLQTGYKLPRGKKDIDSKELAMHLHMFGPKQVLITNGRHGSHVYDGSTIYFAKPNPDKPKDTTGAGDCFGSTYTTGLMKFSGDISKALHLAVVNSTSLVSQIGAQHGLLTWQQANTQLKKIMR